MGAAPSTPRLSDCRAASSADGLSRGSITTSGPVDSASLSGQFAAASTSAVIASSVSGVEASS